MGRADYPGLSRWSLNVGAEEDLTIEDDIMMKAEALNMDKGATNQGIQAATGSRKKARKQISHSNNLQIQEPTVLLYLDFGLVKLKTDFGLLFTRTARK